MLREHSQRSRAHNSADDNVLDPDTFWTLIEKLLLRSSVDSQARNQHNLALSAMCRGRALPRLPRQGKGVKQNENKEKSDNLINEKLVQTETSNGATKTTKQQPDKIVQFGDTAKPENLKRASNEEINATQSSLIKDAIKAKSECTVGDLDVVYVNDSKIPASERLWRYAMKHRKETSDTDITTKEANFIPSARSNAAIYHALKKRLEEALQKKEEADLEAKKKHSKPRKCKKVKPRACRSLDSTGRNVTKTKDTVQKSTSVSIKPVESKLQVEQPIVKRRDPIPASLQRRMKLDMHVKCKPNNCRPSVNHLMNESISTTTSKHDEMENSRALYDCVLKKRLCCGNQLETMNKEIVYKTQNPRATINRDTTKKYAELKNEYLNLCYQECNLRHQIAILHAEIYMMQNKGYHKTPASIKTINLDSKTANLAPEIDKLDISHTSTRKSDTGDVLLFPRLKAPKPLSVYQQKLIQERFNENVDCKLSHRPQTVDESSDVEEQSDTPLPYISDGFPAHGVCSIYSLSPQLAPPQKRGPIMSIEAKISRDKSLTKLSHRLPKMSTINLLKVANKTT